MSKAEAVRTWLRLEDEDGFIDVIAWDEDVSDMACVISCLSLVWAVLTCRFDTEGGD